MTWKDILKRDFDIMPHEARTFGKETTYMNPPENLMRYNTNQHYLEPMLYIEKMIEKRYIPSKDSEKLERLKRKLKESDGKERKDIEGRIRNIMRNEKVSEVPARIAKKAVMKEFEPYFEYMQDWKDEENLQAANKKWAELTHRLMLMIQTALNNLFPTIEEAYRDRRLNGLLFWKGDDYQKLMKESLVDLEAPPTEKEKRKRMIRKPPKKRDYMAERKEIIARRNKEYQRQRGKKK